VIPYTASLATAARRVSIPNSSDPIDENEWAYVFRAVAKSPE
jgi:hypothetical protein